MHGEMHGVAVCMARSLRIGCRRNGRLNGGKLGNRNSSNWLASILSFRFNSLNSLLEIYF